MKEKKEDAGNTSQEDVLTEEVKKLRESIEDKKRLISKIDIEKVEKGIQSLNDYITGVNSRKESIKIQITNKNQLINNILKKEYSDKISYVKKYIDTYNELSEHSKPIVSKKLGLDEVKEQAKDLVKKIKEESELLKKLKEKESKLVVGDDIHEKLKKLKEAKKKVEEEKALIKELAFQQIKFGNELRKVKDGVDLIDDLLIKKREDLDKTQKELDICVKNKNILTFIENIVGEDNVRRLVVADLIKMLNKQIQTYLSSMGADYTCMFDKDLNYTFITSNGETEYGSFSSGEKMRLSIAISFAFRDFIVNRSGINSNILILDEYIDGNLDDLAVTEIFKILREFNVLYNQNIYVISHREAVKVNTFDNVISVDKTNGVSVITKEKGV
jgi:DNA repair exonuclease SbcCD ATPase subunit